jgi:hypothetical protein
MRLLIAGAAFAAGTALAVVAYFGMGAPIGTPVSESFSNPRVPFAATFFVAGVSLALVSLVLYEVLPEQRKQ